MERLSVRSFKQELHNILEDIPCEDIDTIIDIEGKPGNDFITAINLAQEVHMERQRSWILSEYNDYMHGITKKNKNHIAKLQKIVTANRTHISELKTQVKSMGQRFTKKDLYIKELEAKIRELESI
jgi:predicted RNase H-like nuclease (RuvC/YqgF family)